MNEKQVGKENQVEMPNQQRAEKIIEELLTILGYDIESEGFRETPRRFVKFLGEYSPNKEEPDMTTFPANHNNLVMIKDLELKGMCSHHLAPFFGKCSVAYIPNERILGLSKFQRALDFISKVPNEQENVTERYIDYLDKKLKPKGIMVVLEAIHTCMVVRGVQNSQSFTLTMAKRGEINVNIKELTN